ncbi:MAG: tRNA (guanosine(37)-N1)-methyltransferase TrmD [Gammaproteobacteria bacterium]|nr:tRNA (guanosine(37)-N1)-methyltransferase TrmD [Gammaproteobacteria bacterium]
MWIGIVSLFPEMFDAVTDYGITSRAVERGLLDIERWNPRDFTTDRHRTVDDKPYGGGPGMLMKARPLLAAIDAARKRGGPGCKVIHLSPQGKTLDQAVMRRLAEETKLVLVASRYEGIDERVIETGIDEEISIGDYVLSGGEIPAMVLIDGLTRLLPGAVGDAESVTADSFYNGLLDFPQYTRPETIDGYEVPPVLVGGNHEEIRRWRLKQSLGRTFERRPDLLERQQLSRAEQALLEEYCAERGLRWENEDK